MRFRHSLTVSAVPASCPFRLTMARRRRFFIVCTFNMNFPLRLREQMCVKPRKSNH
jgi:hypothetical protein